VTIKVVACLSQRSPSQADLPAADQQHISSGQCGLKGGARVAQDLLEFTQVGGKRNWAG
jgi:hypothetical protein